MYAQTVKPRQWIIVDDGSTDGTGDLLDKAASEHDWMTVVRRGDRGSRVAGTGVITAFYDGYGVIDAAWDFIVKFDGDLSFDADYFEKCLDEFDADDRLGIGGGLCCKCQDGELTAEFAAEPPFHVRGPSKIYRRTCFEAIGGLVAAPGWDTINLIKANMLGWRTRTFTRIKLIHHRPTGGAYGSWPNYVKNGLANYITGYQPVFMACKCLRRMLRRPRQEGIGLWFGFVKGYLMRVPRVNDAEMIRYLRKQQWRALTFRRNLWG